MDKLIDIATVKAHSGLSASALRFYEEKGLIESLGRNGLRRQYSSDVLFKLDLIALGRRANFTIDEMIELFSLSKTEINREKLVEKAAEIEKDIKRLTALRKGLLHAAECPEPSQFQCPKFQSLLKAARNQQHRENKKRAQ